MLVVLWLGVVAAGRMSEAGGCGKRREENQRYVGNGKYSIISKEVINTQFQPKITGPNRQSSATHKFVNSTYQRGSNYLFILSLLAIDEEAASSALYLSYNDSFVFYYSK